MFAILDYRKLMLSPSSEHVKIFSCRKSVTKWRVVKGIFVIRDRPLFFPVKCEMAIFFLVNRDFYSSREPWFSKIIFREMRNKCLFRREPWFLLFFRLRVVSNFGDGDCGADEIHTRARNFEETRREGSAEN